MRKIIKRDRVKKIALFSVGVLVMTLIFPVQVLASSEALNYEFLMDKELALTPMPAPMQMDTQILTITPTPEPTSIIYPTSSPRQCLYLHYTINNWGTGYQVNFKLENPTGCTVKDWRITIRRSDINIESSWGANVCEGYRGSVTPVEPHVPIESGPYYAFSPFDWNDTLEPGECVEFGIIGSGYINPKLYWKAE